MVPAGALEGRRQRANYRRFFDVGTLAAVRVEDPEVFEATHRLLLDLVDAGSLDGLRIDHPDGLADPRGYLRRLADASGGSWVVVEKILEGEETLPEDWPCAGTTGYDALARVGGLFVQPSAAGALQATWSDFADGDPDLLRDMHHVVTRAKHEVVEGSLYAEVHRLVELWCRSRRPTSGCATTPGAAWRPRSSSCSWPSTGTGRTSSRASPRRRPRWPWSSGPPRWRARTCPTTCTRPSTWSATSCWAARPAAPDAAATPTAPSWWCGSSRPADR